LDLIGRYALESQRTRREICYHLLLGSNRAARPYADKIICIKTVKGCRIRVDLCLNAFLIEFADDLLNAGVLSSAPGFFLRGGESDSHK
jgi:hypothetical protein